MNLVKQATKFLIRRNGNFLSSNSHLNKSGRDLGGGIAALFQIVWFKLSFDRN